MWLLVFAPVLLVFLATGHWTLNNSDSVAAAWPAWALVHARTLHLEHVTNLPLDPWFITGAHGHLVSSRMPGVVFIGVPIQALFAWTGLNAMAPSVATAAVVTAAAVANMTLLLRRLSNAAAAITGGLLLAFGTSLWTTAGAELWTHGPDVLWLSAGLLAVANRRVLLAAVLFAPASLTRPHLVVVVFAIACFVALNRRRWTVVPAMCAPSGIALGAVAAYNWYLFGSITLAAGSYSYAAHNAVAGTQAGLASSMHAWAATMAGLLVSPMRGLFVYSPIVLIGLIGMRNTWRALPDWGRGAAVGGLLYLLVQAHINDFTGGFGFYGGRLACESIVLWTPVAFLAARRSWLQGRRRLILVLAVASVGTELVGAAFGRVMTVPLTADPWHTWLPYDVVHSNGMRTAPILIGALLAAVLVAARLLGRADPRQQALPALNTPQQVQQPASPMFNPAARRVSPQSGPTTTAP